MFQAHRGNDAKIPSEHSQAGLSNRDYHLGVKATLDTACCSGNYMRQEYFNSNAAALAPFVVELTLQQMEDSSQ